MDKCITVKGLRLFQLSLINQLQSESVHSKMLLIQKVVWIEIMELLKGFNLLVIKVFLAVCHACYQCVH